MGLVLGEKDYVAAMTVGLRLGLGQQGILGRAAWADLHDRSRMVQAEFPEGPV